MSSHFSDCPWREQSLYAYDSRSSAIFNYYTFGDYELAAESIRMLGQGLRPDGLLELCAPATVPVNIPVFSLAWICSVRDHYLFSRGNCHLFDEFEPTINRIAAAFLSKFDQATGLYRLFNGDEYWAFYESRHGLDFKNGKSFGDDGKFRLDAPHNLYLIEGAGCSGGHACVLAPGGAGKCLAKAHQQLRQAVRGFFWDEHKQLFASFGDRRHRWHFAASVQALAIVTKTASAGHVTALQHRLFGSTVVDARKGETPLVPMTLSTMLYG